MQRRQQSAAEKDQRSPAVSQDYVDCANALSLNAVDHDKSAIKYVQDLAIIGFEIVFYSNFLHLEFITGKTVFDNSLRIGRPIRHFSRIEIQ